MKKGIIGGFIVVVSLFVIGAILIPILITSGIGMALLGYKEEPVDGGGCGITAGVNEATMELAPAIKVEMDHQKLDQKWLNLLLAHVMQESRGGLNGVEDVFQASESLGFPPNTLNKEASIKQGVIFFQQILVKVQDITGREPSPSNEEDVNISSVLYNFPAFGPWLKKERGGKWSVEANNYFYEQVAPGFGVGPGDKNYWSNILKWYDLSTGEVATCGAGSGTGKYRIPVDNPKVTSGFVDRINPLTGKPESHKGIDFGAPTGTKIYAADDGKVIFADFGVSGSGYGGYGNVVELEHRSSGEWTLYGHMSQILVREGQTVKKGDVIGEVGSTGQSTGPHLHFEIRKAKSGGQIDPAPVVGLKAPPS
ncbi:M23 family metallopeptidase [Listeria fleischmannii]|uniref:M23 family metallopeptidase n=1 Tax=Listeria fleischmannii TaxID=1069827 RepID=UPI0021AB9142|nr:M23 family metallopeptidase [Listeria fleischmannii]